MLLFCDVIFSFCIEDTTINLYHYECDVLCSRFLSSSSSASSSSPSPTTQWSPFCSLCHECRRNNRGEARGVQEVLGHQPLLSYSFKNTNCYFLSSMLLFQGKSRDICLWSSQFSATSSELWLLLKPVSNLNKNCTDWICRIDQKFMAQGHRLSAVSWSRWEKGRTANHNQVWYKDGTARLQQFEWLKFKGRKRRHMCDSNTLTQTFQV